MQFRRNISCVAAVALFVIASCGSAVTSVRAQPREATLADCAAIEDELARLACYDQALGRVDAGAVPESPPVAATDEPTGAGDGAVDAASAADAPGAADTPNMPDSPDAPDLPAAPARADVADVSDVPNVTDAKDAADAPGSADATATADVAGDANVSPVAPTVPAEVETGVEVLPASRAGRRAERRAERRQDGQDEFSILVVQRVDNISGLSVFVADDGTVYEQVSTRSSRYPEPPFTAELEVASRGSFWLRAGSPSRPVRVIERR